MSDEPADHRCHRADRCREAERVDGDLRGARIHTEQGLCLTCTRIVEQAIAELPRDYVDLTTALPRTDIGTNDLVVTSPELPTPLRISIAALRHEIVHTAVIWAEPVAVQLGIDWDTQLMDRHARPGWVLQRATRILTGALPALLSLRAMEVQTWSDNGWYWQCEPADGLDGALSLLRCHHITHAALGRTRLAHHLPAPCPSVYCGAMALVRYDGADNVCCEHCHREWSEQDYKRLTLVLASEQQGTAA